MAELIATSSVLFRGTLSAQGHAEKCFLISLKLFSPRVKTSPERPRWSAQQTEVSASRPRPGGPQHSPQPF